MATVVYCRRGRWLQQSTAAEGNGHKSLLPQRKMASAVYCRRGRWPQMSTAAEGDGHSSLLQQQQQAGSQHYGMSSMNNVKAGGRKKKTSIHLHVQHEESEASALRPPGSRHWFSINGRNPLSLTPSPSSLKASVSDGFVESPKRHSQYSAKERCNNNTPSSINWSAEMLVFHSSGLLASVELHAPLLVTAGLC